MRNLIFFSLHLQSLSPLPFLRRHSDDEEEEEVDLNKVFDIQGFQQILCPSACSPPEKNRVYNEQDFEGRVQNHSRCRFWVLVVP